LGFKDPTLWPFFAGERKSGSSRQGFESLLPGKKHQKLPEISQIWATFGTKIFFAVFSAFLRVCPFGETARDRDGLIWVSVVYLSNDTSGRE
jgi:hypothetical protein